VGVATVAGRLAGSYHLKPNFVGRAAHIANAGSFVVRGLRGHGIGERLVRHSMEQALALGFDALQFNAVFASNPARRLYERLGFQVIGSIPDAIDGESIVIYWRHLPERRLEFAALFGGAFDATLGSGLPAEIPADARFQQGSGDDDGCESHESSHVALGSFHGALRGGLVPMTAPLRGALSTFTLRWRAGSPARSRRDGPAW
jgi:hypothetical protein